MPDLPEFLRFGPESDEERRRREFAESLIQPRGQTAPATPAPAPNSGRALLQQIASPDPVAQPAQQQAAAQRAARRQEAQRRGVDALRRGEATTARLRQQAEARGEMETTNDRLRRAETTIPGTDITYSPGAMVLGAGDVATAGFMDELSGRVGQLRGRDYTETRDRARRSNQASREQNPGSYLVGAAAGVPLAAAMAPSVSTVGMSRAAALGTRALEGGIYGGIGHLGTSDREFGEAGGEGEGLQSIATGSGFGVVGEVLGQGLQAARSQRRGAAEVTGRDADRDLLREAIAADDPLMAQDVTPGADRRMVDDRLRRMNESRAAARQEVANTSFPSRSGSATPPAGRTDAGSVSRRRNQPGRPEPRRAVSPEARAQLLAPVPGPDARSYGLVDELLPRVAPQPGPTSGAAPGGGRPIPEWLMDDNAP
jgi:hypothetical protein